MLPHPYELARIHENTDRELQGLLTLHNMTELNNLRNQFPYISEETIKLTITVDNRIMAEQNGIIPLENKFSL